MQYRVEGMSITGHNRFGRTSAETTGLLNDGIEKDVLEETLRAGTPTSGAIELTATLPIELSARLQRNGCGEAKSVVILTSGSKRVTLSRRSVYNEAGDIGVSCSPSGSNVPVDTINIPFRDIHDKLTDRGIVWVHPGKPTKLTFVVMVEALKVPGRLTKIVEAAEKAMHDKILVHF